jgi:hypothetical protein
MTSLTVEQGTIAYTDRPRHSVPLRHNASILFFVGAFPGGEVMKHLN